jgi:hypothetical protein
MKKSLLVAATAAIGIAMILAGCGGGGSGHSDAYNRGYKYGSTHGDPRGNFMTNLTCTQYGNQEQIDSRDDSVQGCLDGSKVAPTPSPIVIPGF